MVARRPVGETPPVDYYLLKWPRFETCAGSTATALSAGERASSAIQKSARGISSGKNAQTYGLGGLLYFSTRAYGRSVELHVSWGSALCSYQPWLGTTYLILTGMALPPKCILIGSNVYNKQQ